MKEIEYIAKELISRLDELAVDDLLRLKVMLYLHHSLESEETLDNNCEILDMYKQENEKGGSYVKSRHTNPYGNNKS